MPRDERQRNDLRHLVGVERDEGLAVDVALDEDAKRIYAVGNVGGDLGTDGRVWILNAAGLI